MQPILDLLKPGACRVDEPDEQALQHSTAYTVQKGDTLSKLAAGLQRQGLVGSTADIVRRILTLNPQIKDANRIAQGATLQLPAVPAQAPQRQAESKHNRLEDFSIRYPMTPAYLPPVRPGLAGQVFSAGMAALTGKTPPPTKEVQFLRTNGKPFPKSKDGTPQYKQNDLEEGGNWGKQLLGDQASEKRSIGGRGCAMTSVAMALSKLSGQTITPAVLDESLDKNNGYDGNSIKWAKAGKATASPISVTKTTTWNLDTINKELDAGRPVVLGVDYKPGFSGGNLGTDHWVCLTRRDKDDKDIYYANDPTTGAEIRLKKQPDGKLLETQVNAGRGDKCRSSGEFVTFSKPVQS